MLKKSLTLGSIVLVIAMLFAIASCEGPVGPAGDPGATGATGATGADGKDGVKGDAGAAGAAGATGAAGEAGAAGAAGAKGDKGDQGLLGPIGPEGPIGPDGEDGDDGLPGGIGPEGKIGGLVISAGTVTPALLEAAFDATQTVVILDGTTVTGVSGVVPNGKTLRVLGAIPVTDGEELTVETGGTLHIWQASALKANAVGSDSGKLVVAGGGTVKGDGALYLPYVKTATDDYVTYVTGLGPFTNKLLGAYDDDVGQAVIDAAGVAAIFALGDGPDDLTVYGLTNIADTTIPGGKTLTVYGTSTTVTNLSSVPAGTLVNKGIITTDTTTLAVVAALTAASAADGGVVAASGAVTGIVDATVPAGSKLALTGTGSAVESTLTAEAASRIYFTGISGLTTATTNDAVLRAFMANLVEPVSAVGIVASGIVTELTAPLAIPEDVTLELSGASTFAAGAYDITVAGTLTLTNSGTNLAPLGSVKVAENGTLALTDDASSLTVAATKILTIAGGAIISGDGEIIADAGTITVGVDAGYTTVAAGVKGSEFATALTGVVNATTVAALTEGTSYDLKTTFFYGGEETNYYGIGSVTLANTTATPVDGSADGSNSSPIAVSNGDPTIADGTGVATAVGGTAGVAGDISAGDFTLTIDGTALKIADSAATDTNDRYGIVEFANVKLQSKGLIAHEVLPTFHVGVKTIRGSN